jgi:DNA polymerase-3 subunit epsilon
LPSGQHRQWYINPERDVPEDATRVHGLTTEFLARHRVFGEVVGEFLEFMGDAPLIAHNAQFDTNFLNAEVKRLGLPPITAQRRVIDTVQMARQRFPGSPASLDALCKRFGIDNSGRNYHGALLDATLLADVYLELLGGRQTGFTLTAAPSTAPVQARTSRVARPARPHAPTEDEARAHQALVAALKKPLWLAD